MDAFFVSVELRRHPELRGRPVVVGGAGPRGVVAAASYEARRYGVHSAMPSVIAKRRCPDAVFLAGDHAHYSEVSAQVREIFDWYSPLIEPISLDEAFLDVSGSLRLFGTGAAIGQRIREAVSAELGLTCSVGVAPNKFLAKLASVEAKPIARPDGVQPGPGVVVVENDGVHEFLAPLPVGRLWGVGPVTLQRLQRIGISTVGELARTDERILIARLGRAMGRQLSALAAGRDDRPVEPDRVAKSIGHEETYPVDLHRADDIDRELVRLADAVAARLRAQGTGARSVTLKVRGPDMRTITRSVTLPSVADSASALLAAARRAWGTVDTSAGVRLLGISAHRLGAPVEQLQLFHEQPAEPDDAIDAIRSRFGADAIGPTSALGPRGLRAVRPGSQPWGPESSGVGEQGRD